MRGQGLNHIYRTEAGRKCPAGTHRYLIVVNRRLALSAASLPGYLTMTFSRVVRAASFLFSSNWLLAIFSIASGTLGLSG